MKFPYKNMIKAKILLFKKKKEKRKRKKEKARFNVAYDFQKFMDPLRPPAPMELFSAVVPKPRES